MHFPAFSAPTFTIGTDGSLTADAQKWFPQPDVIWSSQSGQLLNSSSQYSNNSAGIMHVVSVLKGPVKPDDTYSCVIQNNVVKAVAQATVTGKSNLLTKNNVMALRTLGLTHNHNIYSKLLLVYQIKKHSVRHMSI